MMISLELLSDLLGVPPHGEGGVRVSGVVASSREAGPGSIFVAVRGTAGDGHRYVEDAFAAGCAAAVVEDRAVLGVRPGFVVPDSRRALSRLAAFFAGSPTERMHVIGITGTNGKTTTNWLIYHLLNAVEAPCVRLGTLGVRAEGILDWPGHLTTPDPVSLHRVIAEANAGGAVACVLEASSHALDQARVEDVAFDVGVFTNLTRDHLDYHLTMEAYYLAKRHLFELLARGRKTLRAAVINLDDEYGRRLYGEARALALTDWSYGTGPEARVRIVSFEQSLAGSVLTLSGAADLTIRTRFLGRHNAGNLAAAAATGLALGIPESALVAALERVPQVPGRLEIVPHEAVGVFVDYAHTPDALEKVLAAVRELTRGRVWVVFGCGGDRDRGKRPEMAAVAARGADSIVVTSDNPRTEDPGEIIRDILSGGIRPTLVTPDRRRAIAEAISLAAPGDVVLIAGKGHEDYQLIGGEKHHFSDVEEARAALRARGIGEMHL